VKNAEELRAELSQTFAQLKAGEIKPNEAAELANLAGKMIASAKVQVEYYALRKESPRIDWLESPNAEVSGGGAFPPSA
jgi:5-formyltetrahydrofolate cyclo-ligase